MQLNSRDPDGLSHWRDGKPAEDPDKMKRWGLIVAKPSEYLVHVRAGRVLEGSSGQGASCFKLPWDAVAMVPTSLQRLRFRADQITREKVGVEVEGLGVYRIADPLIAYRVLNFSYPERAQEKLTEALTAMFVGAARRLIANLSVEDCLQKRKQAIAGELLEEVRPVVGGQGRPDDETDRGWGVVIDTIEIQEVRVLSEQVFQTMQAPYRATLERAAREARAEAERDVAMREVQFAREREEASIAAELARERARIEADIEVDNRRVEAEVARRESITKARLRQLELERTEAEAEVAVHASKQRAFESEAEVERARAALKAYLAQQETETASNRGKAEAQVALAQAEAQVRRSEAEARVIAAQNLPQIASAMGAKLGSVQVHHFGVDAGAFSSITDALQAVLRLANAPSP